MVQSKNNAATKSQEHTLRTTIVSINTVITPRIFWKAVIIGGGIIAALLLYIWQDTTLDIKTNTKLGVELKDSSIRVEEVLKAMNVRDERIEKSIDEIKESNNTLQKKVDLVILKQAAKSKP